MKLLEPGYYIRVFNEKKKKFVYYRLLEREAPMKYPYTFDAVGAGEITKEKVLEDLEPAEDHIYHLFLGVRDGIKVYVWFPYDEKMLKLDETDLEDVKEEATANLEYNDSPYLDPKFSILVTRNNYPGLVVKNVTGRTIHPQVMFLGAKYNYEKVTNPDILEKLKKHIIRSTPMVVGKIK